MCVSWKSQVILFLVTLLAGQFVSCYPRENGAEKVFVTDTEAPGGNVIDTSHSYFSNKAAANEIPNLIFITLGFAKSNQIPKKGQEEAVPTGETTTRSGSNFIGSDWITLPLALVFLKALGRISLFVSARWFKDKPSLERVKSKF